MILSVHPRASRRWMWLPIGSAVAVWGAFVLTGATSASGAAAKKAKADDPLTWFSNAIEEQYSKQNGEATSAQTFVFVKKIVATDGNEQQDVDVQVLTGDDMAGLPGGVWTMDGGAAPRVFIARSMEGDGVEQHFTSSVFIADESEEDLTGFLKEHPTADANADGTLNATERNAYLTALALSDPAGVMAEYPDADGNSDGTLDANEAARLVTGGPGLGGLPMSDKIVAGVPLPGGPHAVFAAPAGGMMKIMADVDVDAEAADADGGPQIIKLRTRIVGEDGKEIAIPDGGGVINLGCGTHAAAPADGERRVIVKKIVQQGDAPAEVTVTVNGQPVDPAEIEDIDEGSPMKAIHDKLMNVTGWRGLHGAFQTLHGVPSDAAGESFEWKVAAPASHWLLENVTADVTAADVAKLIPTVEQAPLASFMAMNPDSDADGDGKVTVEERKAFVDSRMSKARTKLLERFPDADANSDGTLTNDELHEYFKNKGPHGEWREKAAPAKEKGDMGPPTPDKLIDGC